MATYAETDTLEREASPEDITQLMAQKAHEMFCLCDKEEKGFITKRDMQRLQTELPLSAQQLEDVFDSLDDDKNGYLTLEEFTGGFGNFLGLAPHSPGATNTQTGENATGEQVYEHSMDGMNPEIDEQNFEELLDHLDAKEVFEDMDAIKAVWTKLRHDEPELLGNFEEFLSRMTVEIKKTQTDFQSLESALRNKSNAHDEEVRRLYEEMEQQIKLEKERILKEEKNRERQKREELEKDMKEKDRQLQELLLKHQEMEERLQHLNTQESETKQENEKLQKERDKLETMLDSSQKHLQSSRDHINDLKSKQRYEKRDRAMAALQISEGIAMERESLVKQLEMLREMNRKLRDERDESDLRRLASNIQEEIDEISGDRVNMYNRCDTCDESEAYADRGEEITGDGHAHCPSHTARLTRTDSKRRSGRLKRAGRQGSVMSDYFDDSISSRDQSFRMDSTEFEESGDTSYLDVNQNHHDHAAADGPIAHDDIFSEAPPHDIELANSYVGGSYAARPNSLTTSTPVSYRRPGRETSDSEQDDEYSRHKRSARHKYGSSSSLNDVRGSISPHGLPLTRPRSVADELAEMNRDAHDPSDPERMGQLQRKEPVGANSTADSKLDGLQEEDLRDQSPERVFKVVFVGDSGVGKSSFIHRFCNNDFKHTFSATIGVDFQVKKIRVDSHLVALQLWDTAGQERFRSITKQYFRKADGVFVMYDVTSETSFKNVRNWMISVQEGVLEGTVCAIIGNKIDLVEEEQSRVVTTKDGVKLADEYEALFYETSARSGESVKESVQGVARLLCEREDSELEKTLTVGEDTAPKKKGCCD